MAGQRFTPRLRRFTFVAGFLTLFALILALASRAEAFVYWTDSDVGIGRANLNGTGIDPNFIAVNFPDQVAVNATHIYWLDPPHHGGAVGRAKLDGTGVDQGFLGPVNAVTTENTGVAVDATHIYTSFYYEQEHSNGGCDGDPPLAPFCFGHGYIARGQLADIEKRWASIQLDTEDHPGSVAVDDAHVYWANDRSSDDTIARANLDLTSVDKNFITGVDASDVTVDDAHIYWADRRGGAIGRANLDGTGVDPSFITGVDAGRLAVDAGHIYFTNRIGLVSGIGRAKLDGTEVDLSFITGGGFFGFSDVAVDALRSPSPSPPPLAPPPSNEFSFGKLKKNKKRGTAKLTVGVPGPGELDLAKTKRVKADDETAEDAGKERLRVEAKGKAKKRLNRRDKAKVKAKVTYTPEGGEPNTKKKKIKLRKR
jgi:hypothetical protein